MTIHPTAVPRAETGLLRCLGLRALDRVALRPSAADCRRYSDPVAWGYFLRALDDARFEFGSPLGRVDTMHIDRVESIEARSVPKFRAISEGEFLRGGRAYLHDGPWMPVTVLGAQLNPYRTHKVIDGFRIAYDDGEEWSRASQAIIHPEDWKVLASMAKPDCMPVWGRFGRSCGNADGTAGHDRRRAVRSIRAFFASALAGGEPRADHDLKQRPHSASKG